MAHELSRVSLVESGPAHLPQRGLWYPASWTWVLGFLALVVEAGWDLVLSEKCLERPAYCLPVSP